MPLYASIRVTRAKWHQGTQAAPVRTVPYTANFITICPQSLESETSVCLESAHPPSPYSLAPARLYNTIYPRTTSTISEFVIPPPPDNRNDLDNFERACELTTAVVPALRSLSAGEASTAHVVFLYICTNRIALGFEHYRRADCAVVTSNALILPPYPDC